MEYNGIKECFCIETFRGNQEFVTEEHPFLVWESGEDKPKWKKTKHLYENDCVAIMKELPVFGDFKADIDEIKANAYLTNKVLPKHIKNANKDTLRVYIKTLFELDANYKKHEIVLKNESNQFLHELKTELLKFGVCCSIRFEKFLIIDDCIEEFIKEFGVPENLSIIPENKFSYSLPNQVQFTS